MQVTQSLLHSYLCNKFPLLHRYVGLCSRGAQEHPERSYNKNQALILTQLILLIAAIILPSNQIQASEHNAKQVQKLPTIAKSHSHETKLKRFSMLQKKLFPTPKYFLMVGMLTRFSIINCSINQQLQQAREIITVTSILNTIYDLKMR